MKKLFETDNIKLKESLSTQAILYFMGRVTALALTFLVPIVLVRIFSKHEYGQYAQFTLLVNFFFRILQFGFRLSLYYFLPEDRANQRFYVINTTIFLAISGLLALFIFIIFHDSIAGLFSAPELSPLLPLCGLVMLFMLVSCTFEPILVVQSKAAQASLILVVSEAVNGICVIGFVLIYQTIFSAVLGVLCYSLIRFAAYFIFIWKNFGIHFDKNNFKFMKRQLQYILPTGLSGIISNTHRRIDKLILAALFSPEIYAIYSVGMLKVPLLDTLFTSVGEVVLPRAVQMLRNKQIEQFLDLWRKILVRFSYVGFGAFFVIQLVAYDLFTLFFTIKYESGVPIFRIATFIVFGKMLQYGIILRSIGETGAILKSNVMAFVIAIPLTFVLVSHLGASGAAISALSAYFINAVAQLYYSVKGLDKKVQDIFPIATMLKLAVIGSGLFLVLYNLQGYIPYRVLRIFLSSSIFLVLYGYICRKINIYNILEEKFFKNLSIRLHLAKA